MKIILNTYRSNKYADGYDYAYLEITPLLASVILDRVDAFKNLEINHGSLAHIEFHGSDPIFLNTLPASFGLNGVGEDDDVVSLLGSGSDYVEIMEGIATDEDFEALAQSTECDRMVVTGTEVYWTCYPKHQDWHLETRPIPVGVFRKIIAEAEGL